MEGITKAVAEFIANTKFKDIPEPDVTITKQVLLDSIGVCLASYITDRTRVTLGIVEDLGGPPQASVIGYRKASYATAAFANGEMTCTMDFNTYGPLTPSISHHVVPSCLVIAERANASGKDLITALAVGMEAGGRIGSSITPAHIEARKESPYFRMSPRICSTQATIFGSSGGAAKLLGFDSEGVANTFGVAGASAPVPSFGKSFVFQGPSPMLKYNGWFGWWAQLAVTSAIAVEHGFTADPDILDDGEYGFWQMVGANGYAPHTITEGLGRVWNITKTNFKKYPCGGMLQTTAEAVNAVMEQLAQNRIKPENIESIAVMGNPLMIATDRAVDLHSFAETQYLAKYVTAVAIYHGMRPDANWSHPTIYNDPKIRDLMEKIRVILNPETEERLKEYFSKQPGAAAGFGDATVEITAKGKKYSATSINPRGHHLNPMTSEEIEDKFRKCAAHSLIRTDKVELIIKMINELENVSNVKELTQLLLIES